MTMAKIIRRAIIDYSAAQYCIEAMRENGTYRGEKIGVIRRAVNGNVSAYEEGRIVLFRDDKNGTITVETPMSREEIARQRERKSLLTTVGTIVAVPRSRISQIRI